jgi:hypothetical protein
MYKISCVIYALKLANKNTDLRFARTFQISQNQQLILYGVGSRFLFRSFVYNENLTLNNICVGLKLKLVSI